MVENRGFQALCMELLTCAAVPLPQVMTDSADKSDKKGFTPIPNGNPTAVELDQFEINWKAALLGTDAGFLLQDKEPPSLAALASQADIKDLIEVPPQTGETELQKQSRTNSNYKVRAMRAKHKGEMDAYDANTSGRNSSL